MNNDIFTNTTNETIKKAILWEIQDIVSDLTSYSRQEKGYISSYTLTTAIGLGVITINEIIDCFAENLRMTYSHLNTEEQEKL